MNNWRYEMDRVVQGDPITKSGVAHTHTNDPAGLVKILSELSWENVQRFAETSDLQGLKWGIHQWTSQADELDRKYAPRYLGPGILVVACWRIAEIYAEAAERRFHVNLLPPSESGDTKALTPTP